MFIGWQNYSGVDRLAADNLTCSQSRISILIKPLRMAEPGKTGPVDLVVLPEKNKTRSEDRALMLFKLDYSAGRSSVAGVSASSPPESLSPHAVKVKPRPTRPVISIILNAFICVSSREWVIMTRVHYALYVFNSKMNNRQAKMPSSQHNVLMPARTLILNL